jgi:hypothetical protein
MDKHDIMTLLNNAVFPTEHIQDKVDELTRQHDCIDCIDLSIDLAKDSDETIECMLMGYYDIKYVVGFAEIDDKFSKLIIRKVG